MLSDNSVVGHTRINRIVGQGFDLAFQVSWKPRCGIHTHPRDGRPARAGWRLREGEWHSPNEQFHGQADVRSACAAFWNEPLRIEKKGQEPAVCVVRRQGRWFCPVVSPSFWHRTFSQECGGPIGVVKLLRARGGCLGVIRFGRGRLRKVRGSCPTSVEPGMPEQTQGTETSQYLEERKSTETPLVAASERGRAQTRRDTVWGRGAGVTE